MIPYGKQSINETDIQAVVDVLRSEFLTTGPKVEEFENAFAEYCGVKHAVSCANGTAALHLAMLAAGVEAGDRIVTSPMTFLASANAGAFVGANVDFCDVEPVAGTLCAEKLESGWKTDTKAVVAVDYAGHPANHEKIGEIARERGAILIEDGCHAVGGEFRQGDGIKYKIGGIPAVDMTTFSFHPVKTITTGEGGMVTTNRDDLAQRLRIFRSHGMVRDQSKFTTFGTDGELAEIGPWAYEMQELGFNYRLTDMQCALGLSQLARLDEFVSKRNAIVEGYNSAFRGIEHVETPRKADWNLADVTTSWHLYVLRIRFSEAGISRSKFVSELLERGVGTQVHYIPVSLQPFYRKGDCERVPLCEAEKIYRECISLPLFPDMTSDNVEQVIDAIKTVLQ